jgi:hypothetical protein
VEEVAILSFHRIHLTSGHRLEESLAENEALER